MMIHKNLRKKAACPATYERAWSAYFHSAGRSSPVKIRLFPESIVLAPPAIPVLLTGAATAHQSTWTRRQDISCGNRLSYDPRSIAYAATNTFQVPTGAASANYLSNPAAQGNKLTLEDSHVAPIRIDMQSPIGRRVG